MLRALTQGRERDVDGDVATADDHHPRPDMHRLATAHGVQEVETRPSTKGSWTPSIGSRRATWVPRPMNTAS